MGIGRLILRQFVPGVASGPSAPADFWVHLRSLGGVCMWDGIEGKGQDLQWMVDGLTNNTLIYVTDGSYDKNVAPNTSGAIGKPKSFYLARKLLI